MSATLVLNTSIVCDTPSLGSPVDTSSVFSSSANSSFPSSPVMETISYFDGTFDRKDKMLGRELDELATPTVMGPPKPELLQEFTVCEGEFRPVAIASFQDLICLLRIAKWKVSNANGHKFVRHDQLPYFSRMPEEEAHAVLKDLIADTFPSSDALTAKMQVLTKVIISSNSTFRAITAALEKAFELIGEAMPHEKGIGSPLRASFSSEFFNWKMLKGPDRLQVTWPESLGSNLLAAITSVAKKLREQEIDPSFVEFVVFHCGYDLLRQGALIDSSDARFIGTPGFRTYTQTYMSLTDPGEGHIFGTTRRDRWLRGALCHVEHLERPNNLPRSEIESYRVPSLFEFARVRLHTGNTAPNTYFVGRKLADSESREFGHDFIKVINLTASACSAAFQLGAAETKIAMDGLVSSQMVAYMRGLAGHVLRNHKQVLSCAFNINMPFRDDLAEPYEDGSHKMVTEQMDIGRRGIEIAAMVGAQKVTFDGASDSYPSQCVILQLGFQNALELNHLAHQAGLTTYMSAGFKFQHIADAVLAGVDGIGIGGAQVLRYMDSESGNHGPYTEENIDRINEERDKAFDSARGQGVHLLVRLDRMFFEGTLTPEEEALRPQLYAALHAKNEQKIYEFLNSPVLSDIRSLPDDGESPTVAVARRLLRVEQPLLRGALNADLWDDFCTDLQGIVERGDEKQAYSYYSSQSWVNLRKIYRQERGMIRDDLQFTVKATPYSKTVL